ncbi:unnamed protein product [Orchesella dallaii]|uniref:Uncharacterized protein n=1 Tax=Orchesella dallaii TaxID=48710 RepID=A0ABP1PUK5_9HEXA
MATSRKNARNSRLNPMSEEECAQLGNYIYCPRNIRSPEIVEVQQRAIATKTRKFINGYPRQCGCELVNGKKCATGGCPNWKKNMSCIPTCGPMCQNNPWAHNTFAANTKTFLRQTEYGWGVFSCAMIPQHSLIGEYTGLVTLATDDLTVEQDSYVFILSPRGYVIQAFEQGSRMRCVNHSCDPNCRACEYIDQDEFKIVYYANVDIPPNTQLTVDYGWVWPTLEAAPPCKCGTSKCKNIIGRIVPKKKQKKNKSRARQVSPPAEEIAPLRPQPFRSTVDDATSEVIEILTMTPRPQERPDEYVEQHVFRAAEPAYIITQYNGRLGIVQGRITECYTNDNNITIYVVDVRSPTAMEYHMPRFLCFHYPEDAAFVFQHLIPQHERDEISHYSTPYASREVAEGLHYNIVEQYEAMFNDGTRPTTRLERRNFPGPVAIGLPPLRLVQVDSDEEPDEEMRQNTGATEGQSRPAAKQRGGMSAAQIDVYAARKMASTATVPQTGRDEGPTKCVRAVIVEHTEAYNPYQRRDFASIRDNLHNISLARRNLESAKENVIWFAASRTPDNVDVDFNDFYAQVAAVLDYFYNEARPSQRRFLTFSHFNVANETNNSGSTLRFYCSFCNKKFNDDEPLRNHFHMFHSIVAVYKCPLCEQQFSLPSLFRMHIFTCDETLGLSLILNINLPVVDGFADYLASRAINNAPRHVLQPGLPNFTRHARSFKIQSSYKNVLDDWPVHRYIADAPNQQHDQVIDAEDPQPGPSNRRQGRQASRERRIRNQDSDEESFNGAPDNVEDDELDRRPGHSMQPPKRDQRRSKKRSRHVRRLENQNIEEEIDNPMESCGQGEVYEEDPGTSNKSRKTVKARSKLRSQQKQSIKDDDDDRLVCDEQPGRLTRAAAAKIAGTVKVVEPCQQDYSWAVTSSESSDEQVSMFQPDKRRRHK